MTSERPHPASRRALGLATGLALCLSLATACTGGTAPAPSGSGAAVGTAAGTPSGSPGATGPATSAATPATPGATVEGGAPNPSWKPLLPSPSTDDALPGMYGLASLDAVTVGNETRISTLGSCAQALATIQAGDWRSEVFMRPTDVPEALRPMLPWYVAALETPGGRAMLRLAEGTQDCDGTITRAVGMPLAISGATTAKGQASFLPFLNCGPALMDDSSAEVTGMYDGPGDVHAVVQASFTAALGEQDADSSDGPMVQVLRGPTPLLNVLGKGLKATLIGDDSPSRLPGSTGYDADDGSKATVKVTSLDPLTGEFHLTGLVDAAGKRLDVSAGFACSSSVSGPKAPAEKPTDAGTVTVTVDSGPHKGTHTGSATGTATSALKCSHGRFVPDGWSVVFSGDSSDGAGDGAADKNAVTMLVGWSAPADQAKSPGALYSYPFLLDIGFGNFIDPAQQLHAGGDAGGSGKPITAVGNTVTISATTADGAHVTVTAQCPAIKTK